MARNGTEFGIRLSGTGDRWFTGPSGMIDGLYLAGLRTRGRQPRHRRQRRSPRRSALGGFAMAAAPAIVAVRRRQRRGRARRHAGDVRDHAGARAAATRSRRSASAARRSGSTAREVVHTGMLPFVNTGIAHREPGVGQIGAGVVKPPMEAFVRPCGRSPGCDRAHGRRAGGRAQAAGHARHDAGYADFDGFVVVVVGPGGPLLPNGVVLTGRPETGRVGRWRARRSGTRRCASAVTRASRRRAAPLARMRCATPCWPRRSRVG